MGKPSFGRLLAHERGERRCADPHRLRRGRPVLRNLRLAGRADIMRLSRQLHRTEDKLERVLQEVESLRDELARERDEERTPS